jgi:hypothetical protein
VVSLTNTTNASDTTTWLGAAIASARKQVAWGAQYLGPNGAIIHRPAGSRGTLTRSLGPGQTTSWRYEFQVPLQPGAYRITAVSGLGHVTLSPSVAFRSVRAPVTAAGLTGV